MKLAIPIFKDDKVFPDVDCMKPRTGVITTAYESAQNSNVFKAMLDLISGSISAVYPVEGDPVDSPYDIKILCGNMPYPSAEAVSMKIMGMINKDDHVEGVYPCPRCGKKFIAEYDVTNEVDLRDRVSDLPVKCMEETEYNNEIPVEMDDPVKIKNARTGETIEEINCFSLRFPTLNDCISAGKGMMDGNEIRVQLKIYVNALLSVNGKKIDNAWKANYGNILFSNIYPGDLQKVGSVMSKYGIKKTVRRECNYCGRVWDSPINTANFFASGLQLQ